MEHIHVRVPRGVSPRGFPLRAKSSRFSPGDRLPVSPVQASPLGLTVFPSTMSTTVFSLALVRWRVILGTV